MTLPNLHEPTIVVPVDFEAPSQRAVEMAVSFAQALEGRVVLVHVVSRSPFPEGVNLLPIVPSEVDHVSQRARKMLEEHTVAMLASGVAVRTEVRTGNVVEAVLRLVEECEASLIVVGTHGRTGAARIMLGSVAEALVRNSEVPVLVARQVDGEAAAHAAPYAGAAVASGVVAGAATGALGGPVGVVVGGALGAVVGGIAGSLVAHEEAREHGHDARGSG